MGSHVSLISHVSSIAKCHTVPVPFECGPGGPCVVVDAAISLAASFSHCIFADMGVKPLGPDSFTAAAVPPERMIRVAGPRAAHSTGASQDCKTGRGGQGPTPLRVTLSVPYYITLSVNQRCIQSIPDHSPSACNPKLVYDESTDDRPQRDDPGTLSCLARTLLPFQRPTRLDHSCNSRQRGGRSSRMDCTRL